MLTLGKKHFVSLLALSFVLIGISLVDAWTAPTANPPGGNITPPVNVGTITQTKDGLFGVDGLGVFGNAIISGVDRYLNFGPPTEAPGETGYGFRDSGGTMEFKNSGDSWGPLLSNTTLNTAIQNFFSSGSTNTINEIHFADGTTQTTAGGGSGGEGGGSGGNSGDFQTFTANGIWNKPAGTGANQLVIVEMWGGGGGNNGGGGAYNRFVLRASNLASTVAVTVGGGGATGNPGQAGGNSSFGTHGYAYGGGGGAGATVGGGGGGIASAGVSGSVTSFHGVGGDPNGGGTNDTSDMHSTLGGGWGNGGNSGWGGGGSNGGDSLYGGAGGEGGTSVYGGNSGVAPGGGGNPSAAGARGEVRVWTVPASGGVTEQTTASCTLPGGWPPQQCTVSCPVGYVRSGCNGENDSNITPPSNACTCSGGGGTTCIAFCVK